MLTPINLIIILSALSILVFAYHVAHGESSAKDTRSHGDKAVSVLTALILNFLNAWILWLVWNHVVTREFKVPDISYVSSYFIAYAFRFLSYQPKWPQ